MSESNMVTVKFARNVKITLVIIALISIKMTSSCFKLIHSLRHKLLVQKGIIASSPVLSHESYFNPPCRGIQGGTDKYENTSCIYQWVRHYNSQWLLVTNWYTESIKCNLCLDIYLNQLWLFCFLTKSSRSSFNPSLTICHPKHISRKYDHRGYSDIYRCWLGAAHSS